MIRKKNTSLGEWSFMLGVLLAVITGLGVASTLIPEGYVALLLVVLGLIVGFLNISEKETSVFLVSTIALIVASSAELQLIPWFGDYLDAIVGNMVFFVSPAAIVVALKGVWELAKK